LEGKVRCVRESVPLPRPQVRAFDRRGFLVRGAGAALAVGSLPALLSACGDGDEAAVEPQRSSAGRAIVGDVVDLALRSDEWEGAFGFVVLRMHAARFRGQPPYFVQTDASDAGFARERKRRTKGLSMPARRAVPTSS
jgi:hypothetical protein